MADRVGQQLGNYQLIRMLGEGGFAEVYLGEHIHLMASISLLVAMIRRCRCGSRPDTRNGGSWRKMTTEGRANIVGTRSQKCSTLSGREGVPHQFASATYPRFYRHFMSIPSSPPSRVHATNLRCLGHTGHRQQVRAHTQICSLLLCLVLNGMKRPCHNRLQPVINLVFGPEEAL